MNDRDRKDLFAVDDPFEDEQAFAPPIDPNAPDARQAADPSFCESGLDAAIARAFDRMGPSAAAEERMPPPWGVLGAAPGPTGRGPVAQTGTGRSTRRQRAKKMLLPAAACLVLLAGVGAFAYHGLVAAQLNSSLQTAGSGAASSSGELASISDGMASEDLGSPSGGAKDGAPEAGRNDGSAGAPPSDGSADAPSSDGSANEGSSSSGSDADARYPFVTLASGQALRIAVDDAGHPLVADPALVGAEIEQATASDGTGGHDVACTVFASASDAHPYAVRYPGDAACYWADEAA